jgi:uncharacterized protein
MYWDTSALLKLYLPEPDSAFFVELISRANKPIRTSAVARVEMKCALLRRHGELESHAGAEAFGQFAKDCAAGRILFVPCGESVLSEAEKIAALVHGRERPVMLRSLDAIHLASAVAIRAAMVVATDLRLRDSAKLLKLLVLPEDAAGGARSL